MRGQGRRRGTRRVLSTLLLGALTLVAGAPAAAQAQISVSDAQASEGAGSVTFTITREAGLFASGATVSFATADGSAGAADYAAARGSRSFPGALFGATQVQHVTVSIAPDALDEADETFRLAVSGDGVTDGSAIGTIADDDQPPSIRAVDAPAVAESGTAVFTVALSARSGRAVSAGFATADGSAVAGQDYTARGGTVTIPAGSTTVQLGVPLTDDGADEPSESFELRLSAPSNATLGDAGAVATILDDDEPPVAPASPPPSPQAATPPPAGPLAPPATGSGSGSQPITALPQLGVSSPRLRLPATMLVTISCPAQSGRCSGRLTVFSRPSTRSRLKALRAERRLGRGTFNVQGGSTRTVRMTLSRRDRALLRRAGRINVRAYVVTTDAAGRTGVRRVNGTLVGRTSHG